MANFIISPYAISFNSIKNALQNYINDKNVSSVVDTWSDFYTAGAGQTIVELDAAVAAFYAFHFIIGRREAFLPVAQNYSSILGGAETLGYNASRGHNIHFNITVIPNKTQTVQKWTTIGSFAEYDIVLLKTAKLTKNEETTLYCTIGNSNAQAITITSSEIQQFTFTADDTTDDCRLILNDMEVPFSTDLEDAVNDKYIMLSNSYGSVDVFYLNQGGDQTSYSVIRGEEHGWTPVAGEAGETVIETAKIYKDLIRSESFVNDGTFVYTGSDYTSNYTYATQDILYLQYIERNNLKYSTISVSALAVDEYGEATDIELVEDFRDVQAKESVKLGASIYHENNNVVRARKDYAKFLLQDNTLNLLDANDHDINPGLMAITYLKDYDEKGSNKLTDEQKKNYMEKVVNICPDGVAIIYIEDPIPVIRNLDITLWQKPDEVIPANVNKLIEEILKGYENILQNSLDLEALENSLEQIEGVKIARVDIGISEYQQNTKYKIYDVITVPNVSIGDGKVEDWKMICIRVKTESGDNAPDWSSATKPGQTVQDYNLLWERANKYISSIPYRWKEKTEFDLYSDVAVGYNIYPNCTSFTQPAWDKVTIIDGNVTFNRVKTYDYKLDKWYADRNYDNNELVKFITDDNKRFAVFYVYDKTYKSSKVEPDWSVAEDYDDTVIDNAITWTYKYDGFVAGKSYLTNNYVIQQKDGKLLVYKASKANDAETVYWYGPDDYKKATERNPLDGREQIYEMKTETYQSYDMIEYHEHGANEYGWVTHTRNVQGDLIWELVDTIEEFITWEPFTELGLGNYIVEDNKYFLSTDISRVLTGSDDWFADLTDAPEVDTDYEDNNIIWRLDQYNIVDDYFPIYGTSWFADTEYAVNDLILTTDGEYDYIYKVVHTTNTLNSKNNVIYSVVNFIGTSGDSKPEWSYEKTIGDETVEVQHENVMDGNILWTKTTNYASKTWIGNTTYVKGDIISTDIGNFVFSNVVGISGDERPDWEGINNGIVEDNNIVWQKLDDSTVINLKWNEHLELEYTLQPIK